MHLWSAKETHPMQCSQALVILGVDVRSSSNQLQRYCSMISECLIIFIWEMSKDDVNSWFQYELKIIIEGHKMALKMIKMSYLKTAECSGVIILLSTTFADISELFSNNSTAPILPAEYKHKTKDRCQLPKQPLFSSQSDPNPHHHRSWSFYNHP